MASQILRLTLKLLKVASSCMKGFCHERAGFKEALSLSDEDAAPVHLDVGRRFLRQRFEAGNKNQDAEERKVCLALHGAHAPSQ